MLSCDFVSTTCALCHQNAVSALSKDGALERRARPRGAANNGYGSSASRASHTRAPKEGAASPLGGLDRQLASRRVHARTRTLDVPGWPLTRVDCSE